MKLTLVHRAVSESEPSLAVFLTFTIVTLVNCTVRPGLKSEPMLLVVFPLSDVFSAICVSVGPVTVCFVILPVSFVQIAVCVIQLALTIGLAQAPLTFVA